MSNSRLKRERFSAHDKGPATVPDNDVFDDDDDNEEEEEHGYLRPSNARAMETTRYQTDGGSGGDKAGAEFSTAAQDAPAELVDTLQFTSIVLSIPGSSLTSPPVHDGSSKSCFGPQISLVAAATAAATALLLLFSSGLS
ncbi:hypothetical protein PTTG_09900 [Puccinia triticina 1-1 BBBD Race 1]|uniref:Uncharacterized protein n=1 Tax=Puccinia triticina (isolate 1-1 / race 1 (BBBD)) TaxID=630390 RepID=A0A180GS09_PUCT1|nr:hypothetical protein PTTG_09900 [Puccinia triticina 1-1 BBBD Race 1]